MRTLRPYQNEAIAYLGLGLKSGGDVETRLVVPYVLPPVACRHNGLARGGAPAGSGKRSK